MKDPSEKGRAKDRPKQKTGRTGKPEERQTKSIREDEISGRSYWIPYSAYDYPREYSGGFYPEGLAGPYGQALAEYEKSLQSLDQAQPDIDALCQTIQSLQGKDREQSLKEWKEYLKSLLDAGKQLTDSIEATIQSLSPQSKE